MSIVSILTSRHDSSMSLLTKPSEKTHSADMAWKSMPIPKILTFCTVMTRSHRK